ncbi:MAG: T9SS type A sorting domain-containing protein [Saprospiraceae bacterium]|nr:T9SS type A sorting domain-containing protein [Saprospiraceae bacterium]
MKYIVLIICLILKGECRIYSQNNLQPDAIWKIGDKNISQNGNELYGTEFFYFESKQLLRQFSPVFEESTWSYSCISGNAGLILYSNGMSIFNRNLEIMENGDSINPGEVHDINSPGGYPITNGMFSVFRPGKDTKEIDIIHIGIELPRGIYENCPGAFLYQTRIDRNANGGLGRVIFKNRIIAWGPFKDSGLAACRHANGRDWWFAINPCNDSLNVFLLGPEGPIFHHVDSISIPFGYPNCQAVFSPDGNFFALHTFSKEKSEVHLLDFDRCTGRFSNHRVWYYYDPTKLDPPHQPTVGVAIPENSQFMYIISREKVHQYDLWAENIPASDQVVAVYDGYMDKYAPTVFSYAHLAPDGKIYIVGRSTLFKIHVIDQPDLKGLACNVKQHSIDLTFPNSFNIPYFPYFRLGREEGSMCDSLITSTNQSFQYKHVKVYPNPASNEIYFSNFGGDFKTINLMDIHGRKILITVKRYNSIDISGVEPGIYFLQFVTQGKIQQIEKIIIN